MEKHATGNSTAEFRQIETFLGMLEMNVEEIENDLLERSSKLIFCTIAINSLTYFFYSDF